MADQTAEQQWAAITPEPNGVAWYVRARAIQDANLYVADHASEEWFRCAIYWHQHWSKEQATNDKVVASGKIMDADDVMNDNWWLYMLGYYASTCGSCCNMSPVEGSGLCGQCLAEARKEHPDRVARGVFPASW